MCNCSRVGEKNGKTNDCNARILFASLKENLKTIHFVAVWKSGLYNR